MERRSHTSDCRRPIAPPFSVERWLENVGALSDILKIRRKMLPPVVARRGKNRRRSPSRCGEGLRVAGDRGVGACVRHTVTAPRGMHTPWRRQYLVPCSPTSRRSTSIAQLNTHVWCCKNTFCFVFRASPLPPLARLQHRSPSLSVSQCTTRLCWGWSTSRCS